MKNTYKKAQLKIKDWYDGTEKIVDGIIVEEYNDGTARFEYPVFDYKGRYSGYRATTIKKSELLNIQG